jgi:hypothetical protein
MAAGLDVRNRALNNILVTLVIRPGPLTFSRRLA